MWWEEKNKKKKKSIDKAFIIESDLCITNYLISWVVMDGMVHHLHINYVTKMIIGK